jgi:hypothetical protein
MDGLGRRDHEPHDFLPGREGVAAQANFQVVTIDELTDDIDLSVFLQDFIDANNIRVI